mmetsp:Transcript_10587/g.15723  ORF Transcript_10587/g.15723 Transcript_10587/m.15723 type:complete len:94 (+) Transcript_10587:247-528(+)
MFLRMSCRNAVNAFCVADIFPRSSREFTTLCHQHTPIALERLESWRKQRHQQSCHLPETGLEPATYRLEVCRAAIAPHGTYNCLSIQASNKPS